MREKRLLGVKPCQTVPILGVPLLSLSADGSGPNPVQSLVRPELEGWTGPQREGESELRNEGCFTRLITNVVVMNLQMVCSYQ